MAGLTRARRRLFAAVYALIDPAMRRPTRDARERLVGDLGGEVLEIGAGTGVNFPFYPKGARVLATDRNEYMVRRARHAAEHARADIRADIDVRVADAMRLPFDDARFDAAVGALVLCSVPEQQPALAELRRVLRPGGALRLFEHVRSDRPAVATAQRIANPAWGAVADGCHLDRDTLAAVREAGFEVERVEQGTGLPMKHLLIFARKPGPPPA